LQGTLELVQPLHESVGRRCLGGGRIRSQVPDGRQLLLRARGDRPSGHGCAAEQHDQFATPHARMGLLLRAVRPKVAKHHF
jgi:hypothetical protein